MMSALRRWRKEYQKFKIIFEYRANSVQPVLHDILCKGREKKKKTLNVETGHEGNSRGGKKVGPQSWGDG